MRFLDILLGRTRPARSSLEDLFSISTARITLEVKADLLPTGLAGIAFKPMESYFFQQAEEEVKGLLNQAAGETRSEVRMVKDHYGYQWVMLRDEDFENLVASLHMTSQTLQEHGFGGQLLAALLEFGEKERRRIYWIYNYKRGRFYPFAPLPGLSPAEKKRDNALELRLRALMEKEMPLEPELERWYPLWDVPFTPESDRLR